ncbi:uncharacterized protein BDR25DRAFT_59551 [Lindgomyces ingoldianus]|uniref:Uncharacterized protein n=1 Tax=Lindgomyces ingoldianus TaxID=673940 RepID=A0ACB6QLH5_9PLEO|nr:uncharacterized protein BDR25DRAFT_59551 [Lindgomyces ingoldianus]KAF2467776.1 hypothetical protein BDR25DRAFT_59551 [Lindgomyces ingoldianus]
MAPKREITVSLKTPMPKGYSFLPKGNQYKTLHCRRLTHEAGKTLFVVEDGRKAVGIRVPKSIFFHVQSLARQTLSSRIAATERRDANLIHQAQAELTILFPKMPKNETEVVLKRAFRKNSGRVGRTTQISMRKKVQLAVIAHIRHVHTQYDQLLDNGMEREDGRKATWKGVQDVLRQWSSNAGKR